MRPTLQQTTSRTLRNAHPRMLLRALRPSAQLVPRWVPCLEATVVARRASAQAYAEQGAEVANGQLEEVTFEPTRANYTSIVGKVAAAPFYNKLGNGSEVTNMMMSVETSRDKYMTMFVDVWGPMAAPAAQLAKGTQVEVEGRLVPAQRRDKETQKMVDSIKLRASGIRTVVYSAAPADLGSDQPYVADRPAYPPPQQDQAYTEAYQAPQQQYAPPPEQQQYAPPPEQQQYAQPTPTPQQQYSGGYAAPSPPPSQQQLPAVVAPQGMPLSPGSPKEALWLELFSDPSRWWDNREGKAADANKSKVPDFKHKDKAANKVLWINSKDTPMWVLDTLKKPAYSNT